MRISTKLLVPALATLIGGVSPAAAAEPNDTVPTATGPLTAGKTFNGSLETAVDRDVHFFYLPYGADVSLTTINAAPKGSNATQRRGRTISSALLRARKRKPPLPLPGTARTVRPKQRATYKVSLAPGKYIVPVAHASGDAEKLADVPFRLRIGPVGSTADSFEIFARRCADAKAKVKRIESSARRTRNRIERAQKNDAPSSKIVKMKLKIEAKREKLKRAKKVRNFRCAIPR